MRKNYWLVLPVFLAFAAAAEDDAPWRAKQAAQWSEDDAREFLAGSPWVKSFTPALPQSAEGVGRRLGNVSIGIPGLGGMGGGRPNGNGNGDSPADQPPPKVTLRWESAMPVRTAELKVHDNDAPAVDDSHYAIAVYGIPARLLDGDFSQLGDRLKKRAALKRDGKKDFKPSSVQVIDRPGGPIVLYLFPMTNEITKEDHRVEFDATIGKMELLQSFFTQDMVLEGKLQL